jgi:hypothetical protein
MSSEKAVRSFQPRLRVALAPLPDRIAWGISEVRRPRSDGVATADRAAEAPSTKAVSEDAILV